ncbi:MAG TPA: choice-of-anchor D domain-containing protein [Vicinamibacterales bacterium]|nr:choice-of-anchor D domain-containing protein [Vicinamibacterales bacterium]
MKIKLFALSAVVLCLLTQRPNAQAGGTAQIFFVDVGQGAGTLIVSPTGKTLLVDGGPPGAGAKIISLLDAKGISQIDYTVVTHYHIDHMGGMIEVLNAGRVKNTANGGVAFDNGDAPEVQPPGTSTSATSTRGTYLNYITATQNAGVGRKTVNPGVATIDGLIDLGGGMRATFLAAGGRLLSGGRAAITNADLNSESVSTLIEYNNFDYLVSGDLTGGGSTSTAKTPDIETWVGQMAGDVDVVQLNHHGSTTTSNQMFLSAVKAEVAVAQTGETNTFGHPNRETVNKYLNTATTFGSTFPGTGVSTAVGVGPVFYQNEASPAGDDRVTQQGFTGAAAGNAGQGTIQLTTDGTTTYSLRSFDDGGVRLSPALHTYNVDNASAGVTTDFNPTVIPRMTPASPLASDSTLISALVNDRESPIAGVTLAYSVNGVAQSPLPMSLTAGRYEATIPAQPDGARVDYAVTATTGAQTTTYSSGYFSGVTPIATIRALNAKGEPLYFGYAARVQGTVTASGFSAGTNDDYVQDATGAVNVYRSTDTPTVFTTTVPGQLVEVNGLIGFNGGRLRLDITESVEKTISPYGIQVITTNPAPSPQTITIAALSTNPEAFEGQFVSIANATITAGTIPATPQPVDAFVTVSDGTGSFAMKIDHDTDVEGFSPGSPFTLVGIVQQDDFLRPFDAGYNVTPRSRVDLGAAAPAPAPLLSIADARIDEQNNVDGTAGADFVPDRLNEVVRVRGTVSSIDFRGGNGIEYYVQDATAGVDLFSSGTNFGPFAIGDTVEAIGTVTQFFGLTELTVTSVSLLSHDAAPAPKTITLGQLTAGGGEAFEGQLVRVDGATIVDTYPVSGSSKAVTIADATGAAQIFIDSDTDIDGTARPGGVVSITGLLGQHAVSAPLDNSYQIVPRSLADIVVTGGSGPALIASPATVAFAATAVGSASIAPVTITNNGTSTLTLTPPFSITDTDASQFQVGAPATTTLAAGSSTTVSVTFAPTTGGGKSATLTITSDAGSTTVALTGTGQAAGGAAPIVISEFRVRGSASGNDEFVEIYNNSDTPADISGYTFRGSNNAATVTVRATVPANVVLPGRAHYLFVNTAAGGYSLAVPGNLGYATGITDDGGIAIFNSSGTVVDQVGLSAGSAYKEGTPLATLGATNANRSYERKPGGASISLQDTGDNSADFQVLTPSAPQDLVLTASPSSVNYGSVAPGDTRSQTITIRNMLIAPNTDTLSTPVTVTGADAALFTAGTPSTTSLAANATATIGVDFRPVDSGAKSANLGVTSTLGGVAIVPLSGTGSGGLSVAPATIDFGTVTPGASAGATVTITNTDATGVTLTPPFAITGSNPGDFGVGAPAATTIDGGASTTLPVAFQPLSAGVKNASLLITTSTGTTRTVTLTGIGTCPAIAVAGPLPNGQTGVPYSGTVTASGGDAPYTFTIAGGTVPPGLSLGGGGVLAGTPTTTGPFTFDVQAAAANGCTGTATFTVTITPPPVVLTAGPSPLDFGFVASGASATRTVTLTNVSATPIVLTTLSVSGPDAARFAAGAPAATTLGPGTSTTAPVTFSPIAGGVRSATLTVATTGGSSASVGLTGIGTVATAIVISEFRFRGPAGGNDEFIEILNTTDAAIDISGYTIHGSNNAGTNSTRATVPANITLPAHAHYLFVNTGAAGYSGAVPGNVGYGTGITDDGGIALVDTHGAIVDQVGLSPGSLYKEGAVLASLGTANADKSYARRVTAGGAPLDSDDNATDFVVSSPSDPQDVVFNAAPASVAFAATPIGDTRSTTVSIRNLLLASVTVTAATIGGVDATSFDAGAPAATTIPAGGTTTVPVSFHPATVRTFSAQLTVDSNRGPIVVDLTGAGTPGLVVSPTSIDFGTIEPGATASSTVTITNGEASTVTLTPPFSIGGADAAAFAVGAPASTSLAAGAETTAAASFHSTALGAKSATLSVTSDNGGTRSVTLTGLVACPAITVSASLPAAEYGFAYSQAIVAAGATGPYTFLVTGGALPQGVALSAAGALAGTPAALGTFAFTVQATAASGCTGTASFSLTVRDTTPPLLALPANIAATATTPAGAVVSFTATATDLVDGTVPVVCAPASGATFPITVTTVACSATDAHGNKASGSFTVTVTTDTVPGRMVGDAAIESATIEQEFSFVVQERASGADAGTLAYRARPQSGRDKGKGDRFDSTSITSVSFFDVPGVSPGHRPPSGVDTVSFRGLGRWNDRSGYSFEAVATDAGEPGRGHDRFALTIRDGAGQVVASVDAVITDGNIQSLRIK